MMNSNLSLLISKRSLTQAESYEAMEFILTQADSHQIAAFLAVLKQRGETVDEILGMVTVLEKKAVPVCLPFPVLDIVGTGGDFANTVNISTGAAILSAACGIPIAKHGNRSVSSRSGSGDVLQALGITLEMPPELLEECLVQTHIGFMFAPYYHPSLKLLSKARHGLRFPTIVNLLGPLLNPAKAAYALIGVASLDALEIISDVVVQEKHRKRTLIFHGCGLDELTPLGKVLAYDVFEGEKRRIELDPQSLGFSSCFLEDLQGGDAHENAALLLDVFSGKQNAIADSLIFNAGAALWIFGKTDSLEEGIALARKVQRTGKAVETLQKWKKFSASMKLEEVI